MHREKERGTDNKQGVFQSEVKLAENINSNKPQRCFHSLLLNGSVCSSMRYFQ